MLHIICFFPLSNHLLYLLPLPAPLIHPLTSLCPRCCWCSLAFAHSPSFLCSSLVFVFAQFVEPFTTNVASDTPPPPPCLLFLWPRLDNGILFVHNKRVEQKWKWPANDKRNEMKRELSRPAAAARVIERGCRLEAEGWMLGVAGTSSDICCCCCCWCNFVIVRRSFSFWAAEQSLLVLILMSFRCLCLALFFSLF